MSQLEVRERELARLISGKDRNNGGTIIPSSSKCENCIQIKVNCSLKHQTIFSVWGNVGV